MSNHRLLPGMLLFGVALVSVSVVAGAQATNQMPSSSDQSANKGAHPPEERVNHAVVTVGKMRQDPQISRLLTRAKGVLLIPHYVKAAAIIGAQGGGAVLLIRHDETWSNPAFFTIGGASIGAQVGGRSGSMALLLMNDKAVNAFENHPNTWTLDGSAGLTVVDYSAGESKAVGDGDVVVWSDTKGLFGGAAVGIRDIRRDEDADWAYYGNQQVSTQQILTGAVQNPHRSNAESLQSVLPLRVASR